VLEALAARAVALRELTDVLKDARMIEANVPTDAVVGVGN
jgi:hypothetical protein